MSYRRINLFAGPGAGKSLTASYLFRQLNISKLHCEQVQEVIKPRAYRGEMPSNWANVTKIFSKQMERERDWLESGVQLVVTDSPLLLQCYYLNLRKCRSVRHLVGLAMDFEEDFPALNIFLRRGNWGYEAEGRWQSPEEARAMDRDIEQFTQMNVSLVQWDADDPIGLMEYATSMVKPAEKNTEVERRITKPLDQKAA